MALYDYLKGGYREMEAGLPYYACSGRSEEIALS